jgi:hypothetical protein
MKRCFARCFYPKELFSLLTLELWHRAFLDGALQHASFETRQAKVIEASAT